MEAGGIEPPSRDVSSKASTCVVVDLDFADPTGQRQPDGPTSPEQNLTPDVPDMAGGELDWVTSIQDSPAESVSRGS